MQWPQRSGCGFSWREIEPGRWGISVFSCLAGRSVLVALTGVIGGVLRRPRGKKIYEEFGEYLGTGATVRA
ncbi:hypothetical protein L836_0118 [Mycobacteroides abscessus MAB_110811_2726]|nr:hypothetical protein L836_0118 [Mycobacteroides abscessus MAB_110811_2726]